MTLTHAHKHSLTLSLKQDTNSHTLSISTLLLSYHTFTHTRFHAHMFSCSYTQKYSCTRFLNHKLSQSVSQSLTHSHREHALAPTGLARALGVCVPTLRARVRVRLFLAVEHVHAHFLSAGVSTRHEGERASERDRLNARAGFSWC